MATGDTARLIASLELQDKFSGTADKANRQLGGLEGNLQRGTRQMGIFGHATATALGIGLQRAVSSGVRLITGAVTGGVAALNELESVSVATNTVIDSTKGVAGQTAAGIRDLAEEYENLNATMDDKVIQSGANMLLTFTNVREDAFEPALEAALNLNEAMGGGPGGLQSAIIQVGKALNDPIQGIGALRRVGVQLTDQQEEQVRTLMEQNDLYGAQQVILDELATQFGGRFANAGRTAEGRQAAFNDRIEDLQVRLAGPLIPAIDRVREKLIDLMGSPAALAAADKLGQAIANLASEENLGRVAGFLETNLGRLETLDLSGIGGNLGDALEGVGSLPWGAIGSAAELMGTGARAVLETFISMPPWVQTAVLTGWGLNKLTGGALTGIVGGLTGALGRWVAQKLGLMTVQAGVVNVSGPVAGAPGGGAGGGGIGGTLARVGAVAAGGVAVGAAAVTVVNFEQMREEQRSGLQGILDELPRTPEKIDESIARIQAQIDMERPILEGVLFNTNIRPQLEAEIAQLQLVKDAQERGNIAARDAIPWAQRNVTEIQNLNMAEGTRFAHLGSLSIDERQAIHDFNAAEGNRFANLGAKQDAVTGAVQGQSGVLAQIRDKPSTVNVTVPLSVTVGVSEVQYRINSLRQTIGGGGFI